MATFTVRLEGGSDRRSAWAKLVGEFRGGSVPSAGNTYRYMDCLISDPDSIYVWDNYLGFFSAEQSPALTGSSDFVIDLPDPVRGAEYYWACKIGYSTGQASQSSDVTWLNDLTVSGYGSIPALDVYVSPRKTEMDITGYFYGGSELEDGETPTQWLYIIFECGGQTLVIRSDEMAATGESSFSGTIDGLSPGTTYAWTATLGYGPDANHITPVDVTYSGTATTAAELIPLWDWNASNGLASAAETKAAFRALSGSIPFEGSIGKVWNDIVDKAAEVRRTKNYTWDTVGGKYLAPDDCKVTKTRPALSAKMYNSVRYNIGSIKATGIFDVVAGYQLYGRDFIVLTDVMNQIIEEG